MRDLGSTNGTLLNGAKIQEATATPSDIVSFGEVRYRVREVKPTAEERASADAIEDNDISIAAGTVWRELPLDIGKGDEADTATFDRERAERTGKNLELLLQISKELSGEGGVDPVLEGIVDILSEVMDVHRVSVLLLDDESKELVPRVSSRLGKRTRRHDHVPKSILARVVDDRVTIVTEDAMADARFDGKSVMLQQVCAAMATPLVSSKGEVLGAIYADRLSGIDNSFSDEDLDFLSGFAGIAGAAIHNSRLSETLRRQAVTVSNFQRYFAPELAAEIAAEESVVQLGGLKKPLSVLFTDIRGFTSLSEGLEPEEVITLLNDFFGEMVDIIFEYGGTLDKFIGDAIMANWGAPVARPDDAERALAAAIDMQNELVSMNRRKQPGEPQVKIGIGINYGEAFVGNIGSHRRLEYTAIGDTVNTASHLCSMAGPGEILVSGDFLACLGDRPEVDDLGLAKLKTRREPTAVYRIRM